MYTPETTREWQNATSTLLKKTGHPDVADVTLLRDVLRFHEYRYYVLDEPLLADEEYDRLFKSLEAIEKAHPDLIRPDSPTQRVANGLNPSFPTVSHLVPMLSLDNSYNAEDLIDWDRRVREGSGEKEVEYCVEPKFDGASISLIYEDDLLLRGATRGDGVQGDDITTNIRQIRSVPLSARFSDYGVQQIEIRGEVLMTKKNFKAFNAKLAEQNLPPLANPRNAASGSLRIKDPAEVKRRNLEAFLYNVSYHTDNGQPNKALDTHAGTLKMLWDLGFRSPEKEKRLIRGIDGVVAYCAAFEAGRDDLPYEIDGMVIKVNDLEIQDKLGMTTHHPRWAIAFKFKARQATSKLRAVEFQVGRTGAITPVAKIDPVPIGGVTVGSISLFNEDVIREKDLMIGDSVLVERAGDVIPYIVKSLAEARNGQEQPITFPDICPQCSSKLFKEPGEAVWRCINIDCPAQVVERIIHFVSKDAMDIKSFGEANVRKFYELGFLTDVPSIYQLPFDKIRALEGFGQKSITNLEAAIEASKKQPLHRLLFGLGIRFVGETTAKTLAQQVDHLTDLAGYSVEELQQFEDIGIKVATSIYQFFHNADNLELLNRLEAIGLNLRSEKRGQLTDGALSGLTFLFTGTLNRLKRSDAEEMVEAKGGKLLGSVSSKLNYLVVGDDAGSKLEKAKKIPLIHIISEEEFLKLIGNA
ncbi:NAD-dependent DNA ligase LigA [Flavihumibacter petaseus]|uniref:DNA ligase n=1 Tax=Flavihumibacter petaseus NBRC 106054 TaxID=1220578 RepID=A0A0E9MXY9_9BACT|nr:NAD-dependent DNA ligase LigA [Flavihumibacter petaseus]GAO41990.1 DNA ligase [Flavihumibacter petaseus NBRC 106054]